MAFLLNVSDFENTLEMFYCLFNFLQADADAFVSIAKEVNEKSGAKQDELDEGLMKSFAYQVTGDVCPMQAVIGGITAQEVMKVRVSVRVYLCAGTDRGNHSTGSREGTCV